MPKYERRVVVLPKMNDGCWDGHRSPNKQINVNILFHFSNYEPHHMTQPTYMPQYAPPGDDYADGAAPVQSRTFKMLQGLMANDGKFYHITLRYVAVAFNVIQLQIQDYGNYGGNY